MHKVLVICLLAYFADGARILAIFPVPGPSHMIVNSAYMKGLAERGHQVTVFSPIPQKKTIPNYKDMKFDINYSHLLEDGGFSTLYDIRHLWHFQIPIAWWNIGNKLCDLLFSNEIFQKFMNSSEDEFDLIVIQAFFNECALALTHKLKVPVIKICDFIGTMWMDEWVGNPTTYSYVPDVFQDLTNRMTFWERLKNTLGHLYVQVGRRFYSIPSQDAIVKKYMNQSQDLPSIYELHKKISLVFVNSDFSTSYPRPTVPNFIEIGGIHLEPPKNLTKDLQKFMDESPNGVICFIMGTNLGISEMPQDKIQAFVEAFSKVKQRVLWKWEHKSLPGQPNNVKVAKWIPQSDVLAHPNTKVFITHGGILSTLEAIDRGVPVIGIPIFGDQSFNMARAVSSGFAVKLEFENITADSILWAINEVLENPRYSINAKKISKIHHDQPSKPLDKAMYWTEYVIRHKGAPHLRSAALELTWYQYMLLDVITVVALAVIAFNIIMYFILKAMMKFLASSNFKAGSIKLKKIE